jgi:hypothetical protein
LKAQVNQRSDAFYNKFKELISIQYCRYIYYIVGGGYYFLEFIEFFIDAGGGAGHFV